jgi:archaellum biogenesis ATPase FlaH
VSNIVAVYKYVDPDTGEILAEKVRKDPKEFVWNGEGADERSLPLYNAHKLVDYPLDKIILFVEGEKSADALEKLGIVAVCLPGGAAAKPTSMQLKALLGRRVAIWPDKDQAGRMLMRRVLERLRPIAEKIWVVYPDGVPAKGDAFDWIQQSGTVKELVKEIQKNPRHVLAEKQLNIINLDSVEPRDIEWLWPGYLPLGMMVMIEGRKGVGKSWLTLQLAAMVSRGNIDVPGTIEGTKGAGKVLMLCHEDTVDEVIVPRLKAMGANLANIEIIDNTIDNESGDEKWFDLYEDIDVLEDKLSSDEYKMLIIDPLNNYINAGLDTYKDSHIRAVLSPLSAMAQRTGVCAIGIRHHKKDQTGGMLDWGIGSIAYGAVARTVHSVVRDPFSEYKERLMFPVETNLTVKPSPVAFNIIDKGMYAEFEWLGKRDYTEEMFLEEARKQKKDKGKDWHDTKMNELWEILGDGNSHQFKHVQDQLGVSSLTLLDYLYRSNYLEEEIDMGGVIPPLDWDKVKKEEKHGV